MKLLTTVFAFFILQFALGQNYLHQVLVLNEGYYDYQNQVLVQPVTVGSYNPATQQYQTVATIPNMRFASDLIIDGNAYYVAADSKIIKFNLNTHAFISEVNCPGVRNLALYQNKLIATRGEYLTTYDSYLHVYDATSLQLLTAIDTVNGPNWASQNVVVSNGTAYIAVNNGYEWGNEKGIIGQLNLSNLAYGNELDLGIDGKNPDNLMVYGNAIYSVNNKDWSGASVSKIDLASNTSTTTNIANAATGCGTSALLADKIVYQIASAQDLNAFDINLMYSIGPIAGYALSFYELGEEPVTGNLYASETDFFSFGTVHIYNPSHQEIGQFAAGVSPGTFGFDVRSNVGITETSQNTLVYPNPASASFTISEGITGLCSLVGIDGKTVRTMDSNALTVAGLPAGCYFIENEGKTVAKIQVR